MKNVLVESESEYKINKTNVHRLISKLKRELKFSISFLQINFVSSQRITAINSEYLDHQGSTDIITFNYSQQGFNLEGDCYICVDTAKENAERFKVTLQNELIRLVIHGVLHLLGYDDIEETDKKKMKQEENRLVKLLFDKELEIIKL